MVKRLMQVVKSPITLLQSSRELPVWQNALIGFTAWFWLLTLVADLLWIFKSNSFYQDNLGLFLAAYFFFGILFLFPLTMTIRGVQYIYGYINHRKSGIPFYKHIFDILGWLIHAVVLILGPFYIFFIIDTEAITLVPFLTTASAIVWLRVGISLTKNQPMRKRLTIIPLTIILILSLKYLDWNSRKPFLQDLYSVKTGMTGAEVKKIMGKYDRHGILVDPKINELLTPDFTVEVSFHHTSEGYGNADIGRVWFQNGKVIQVEFLHD
jgi:hypothetical protein